MLGSISTALSGLLTAKNQINQSAENIARIDHAQPETGNTLPQDIIDIKVAETEFKANAFVIETANEMSEELLKTFDEEV